jgi:hypothetical protein
MKPARKSRRGAKAGLGGGLGGGNRQGPTVHVAGPLALEARRVFEFADPRLEKGGSIRRYPRELATQARVLPRAHPHPFLVLVCTLPLGLIRSSHQRSLEGTEASPHPEWRSTQPWGRLDNICQQSMAPRSVRVPVRRPATIEQMSFSTCMPVVRGGDALCVPD